MEVSAANGSSHESYRRDPKRTTFRTQASAVFLKNLTYQRRNWQSNLRLVCAPIVLCLLLAVLQAAINALLSGSKFKCGCQCVEFDASKKCINRQCGVQYSTSTQVKFCAIESPTEWPAFFQVGRPPFRATLQPPENLEGLPAATCKSSSKGCPATILYTGQDQTIADGLASFLLKAPSNIQSLLKTSSSASDALNLLSRLTPATGTLPGTSFAIEPALVKFGYDSREPAYVLVSNCSALGSSSNGVTISLSFASAYFACLEGLTLWRQDVASINTEIYKGYRKSDPENRINEIAAAYDFEGTDSSKLSINIWDNQTYANKTGGDGPPPSLVRASRMLNLASNAYLKFFRGQNLDIPLTFIKEYPKPSTKLRLDFSSLLGPLFYMWIFQLLFPVMLRLLVYEKEKGLRQMMKMHGLGDGPYWLVSYSYFLTISVAYMALFVIFGSLIDLKFLRINSYSIQILFYFLFVNAQIAFSFFIASLFSAASVATVASYLYVFGSGLLGNFILRYFVQDPGFPRGGLVALQLIPAFSLYRGLYELSSYSFEGNYQGGKGMTWSKISEHSSGMPAVLITLTLEWPLFLLLAYYFEKILSSGSGPRAQPLFFLGNLFRKKKAPMAAAQEAVSQRKDVKVEVARADVAKERRLVEGLRGAGKDGEYAVVCDDLRKVYSARDGNAPKVAVEGMSLAIPRGECFGMLGPNGAGKTTSINMMIGFIRPTSGNATIEGLSIKEDMSLIYSTMGVCPQHDLLWDQLTAREHLLFYGRLKNLKGRELDQAVDASLKSVNLFSGGVGDKPAGKYSGGMKRRLSVAISLIGDPQVVYMDEPSTGLDPASRKMLWTVVKSAKRNRAIILTTHSMEEAEALCDRIGIFVDGEFQCLGNPKELTSRYGGSYVFTITTPVEQEGEAVRLALSLTPNAKKVYGLSGTQKFELPTSEIDVSDVFIAVDRAKGHIDIQAWGVANTTLEDVFIKIAKDSVGGSNLT